MLDWLRHHLVVVVSGGVSVAVLVAGILAVPVVVARLPEDFFSRKNHKPSRWRNILGWALIVAGVAMLVLPGPGLPAILAGIVLADFPAKRKLLHWLFARGRMFVGLNRMRAKRGKPPLKKP